MSTALLLIDLQNDFLTRPGLQPDAEQVVSQAQCLLLAMRSRGIPVFHVHTCVGADGADSMPHWRRAGYQVCVEGTPGAATPVELTPLADETLIRKRFFSAFETPELHRLLQQNRIEKLILAGIYSHACIRATALDAYSLGYEVIVAEDAIGSTEPLHAEITREYLEGRAATFLSYHTLLTRLDPPTSSAQPVRIARFSSLGAGKCNDSRVLTHSNPANSTELISSLAVADRASVAQAAEFARAQQPAWQSLGLAQRLEILRRWRDGLARNVESLVLTMVDEVGKPIAEAREEFQRGLAMIDSCISLAVDEEASQHGFCVRYRPLGVVGLITPWNNPMAIPVGKIAPALAYGNTVVWKPSPQASWTAARMLEELHAAGCPKGVVNIVFGDQDSARHLLRDANVDAISLTGSLAAGSTARALCALTGKPLQAELGGNNGLVVLADSEPDLDAHIDGLARSAFSFSGQRCTAIRRFIVEKSIAPMFARKLATTVDAIRLGDPRSPLTECGPLITQQHLQRVKATIAKAQSDGARLLCGGNEAPGEKPGWWLRPALIVGAEANSTIVQQETFGPVAVIQEADSLEHAIHLANAVPHGLLAGLLSQNPKAQQTFLAAVDAGMLKLGNGPLAIHPEAPFVGWRVSGQGVPEHGVWDRAFYTRVQTVYGQFMPNNILDKRR